MQVSFCLWPEKVTVTRLVLLSEEKQIEDPMTVTYHKHNRLR